MNKDTIDEIADEMAKTFLDEGKLIEAGFAIYSYYLIPKDAPKVQLDETRLAFMAGAEHLWSSMMNVLEEGQELTDNDLRRMGLIQAELDQWRARLFERMSPTKGQA